MCTDRDPPPCKHADLIAQVDRLQDRNARLTEANEELRRQLAAAQRSGKRQAAPFSKGGRVMAAAHVLHYGVGIPVRRVPSVLRALTGVEPERITQDALRRVQGSVGDAYQRLRESVRESTVVHTDDTGWRVGGEGAFLMAFETDDATVYQVPRSSP